MNAAPNFGALLDTQSSAVERPKPLPVGSYLCVVQGLPKYDKSAKKQTEYVEFTLKVLQAGDDVDAEALAEVGGTTDKVIKATYYITENSLWRLKEFLTDCGIEEGSLSLRQMIDETPNCQVIAVMRHEASDDGKSVFARLASTQKPE